jgi:phosphopentomutase
MPQAVEMLHNFDEVLSGLVDAWQERDDLIIISSDHGNLENLEKRGHTLNPVPALCIGPQHLRDQILPNLTDLTSFASAIIDLIFEHN